MRERSGIADICPLQLMESWIALVDSWMGSGGQIRFLSILGTYGHASQILGSRVFFRPNNSIERRVQAPREGCGRGYHRTAVT
jgi:hypothetical protein